MIAVDDNAFPAGWCWPTQAATKRHYFAEGSARSGCGRYGRLAESAASVLGTSVVPETGDPSPVDCVPCRRKLP